MIAGGGMKTTANTEMVIEQEMSDLSSLVDDLARKVATGHPAAASAIAQSLYHAAQCFGEIAEKESNGHGHA